MIFDNLGVNSLEDKEVIKELIKDEDEKARNYGYTLVKLKNFNLMTLSIILLMAVMIVTACYGLYLLNSGVLTPIYIDNSTCQLQCPVIPTFPKCPDCNPVLSFNASFCPACKPVINCGNLTT